MVDVRRGGPGTLLAQNTEINPGRRQTKANNSDGLSGAFVDVENTSKRLRDT